MLPSSSPNPSHKPAHNRYAKEDFLCISVMSSTVSRVLYLMIIYLDCTLPHSSSVLPTERALPECTTGRRMALRLGLLRMGFTQRSPLPCCRWSLTPPFHPYRQRRRFLFCCTFLEVTLTGRYPASCPAKPGLSSPRTLHFSGARSSVLLIAHYIRNNAVVNGQSGVVKLQDGAGTL